MRSYAISESRCPEARGKKAHPFSCKPEKRDPPYKCRMYVSAVRQKKGSQCKYVLDEYVN
jgi:hypothetical protein